jgi:hypothetical protein
MSISYSIDSALDLFYTEENIKYILIRGIEEGFIYFDDESRNILSIDEIVQKVSYSNSEEEDRNIRIKFQDTIFFGWFFKSDSDLLIFSIGSFGYRWDKDFSNGKRMYLIDFARYIRLMFNICKDILILELNTDSDITEDLVYKYKNCVVAVFDMGLFGQQKAGYMDDGKLSVQCFFSNAVQNGIILFDEDTGILSDPSIQKYYEVLKVEFSAYLYAKKDGRQFKVEIVRTGQGYDCIAVYPLEPYRMKKGYGSEEEKIDIAFYVQRLLELCENFAIYELKTFI